MQAQRRAAQGERAARLRAGVDGVEQRAGVRVPELDAAVRRAAARGQQVGLHARAPARQRPAGQAWFRAKQTLEFKHEASMQACLQCLNTWKHKRQCTRLDSSVT